MGENIAQIPPVFEAKTSQFLHIFFAKIEASGKEGIA